jgi:hypothetical protein
MSDTREVHVDNEAEVKWITGNVSSKRSRHMDVKMYTGRHAHEDGRVNVQHISTQKNIADIPTKPLSRPQFEQLAGELLGHGLVWDKDYLAEGVMYKQRKEWLMSEE